MLQNISLDNNAQSNDRTHLPKSVKLITYLVIHDTCFDIKTDYRPTEKYNSNNCILEKRNVQFRQHLHKTCTSFD